MDAVNSSPADGPVSEVAFTLTNTEYPFVRVSREEDCRFELVKMLPREGERYAEFFLVEDVDPAAVEARTADRSLVDAALLADSATGALFEFVVSKGCPARKLAKFGAIPTDVVGDEGTGYIRGEVPATHETSVVVESFLDAHPSAELVAKSGIDRPTPLLSGTEIRQIMAERLTDRQREVLRAAWDCGYYERPRETTAQELATELDVSVSTVSQHLRAAERHLLALLYENGATGSNAPEGVDLD